MSTDNNNTELQELVSLLGKRPIVLIGLMGAGKSSVGKRLAAHLKMPFKDADTEIEKAAGLTIQEIFDTYGETYFRDGERRVIKRLMESGAQVVATGGGAYMDEQTRKLINDKGISVWIKGDLDLLMKRVSRRSNRPLLKKKNPRMVMKKLIDERYPVYALSDITVETVEEDHEIMVKRIKSALIEHLGR